MIKKILILSLTSILLLSGCSKSDISSTIDAVETGVEITERIISATEESSTVQGTEKVTVLSVIDGDTIVFRRGTEEVRGRLLCINSPENTSKKEYLGDVSTKYLKELIEGKEVTIQHDIDTTDKYQRELIHVFYNGQNVNQLLIEQGLTRVAYLYDDYQYVDLYKKSEEIAKQEGRGVWAIPNYVVESSNGYDMSVIH